MLRLVERDVELVSVECPRYEDEVTLLFVEREVAYVQRAVRIDDSWEHPEHQAVRRHDRIRVHAVTETVVHAAVHRSQHQPLIHVLRRIC